MNKKLSKDQQSVVDRILVKRKRISSLKNARLFPQIWERQLNEETFLALIANYFPLHISLKKMLLKLARPELKNSLLLSTEYLYKFRRCHPSYYSDRERLIVYCNRFIQTQNEASILPAFSDHHLTHLLKGIIELNSFLFNLREREKLVQAKLIFQALEDELGRESKCLLAFIHYLEGEFNQSSRVLSSVSNGI